MHVTLRCPGCAGALPFEAASPPDRVRCGRCSRTMPVHVSKGLRADRTVDTCPHCAGGDFYIRKDFDPKLGLAVIITGAGISAAFYWAGLDLVAYGVLGTAALVDLVVYGRLRTITVCYRCHTEFRGRSASTAPPFDLASADRLELEWAREVEKRTKRS